MAEVQHLIQVSDYEQRLMVNGLNAFRNDLIRDGKPTEDINALLIKVMNCSSSRNCNSSDLCSAALPGRMQSRSEFTIRSLPCAIWCAAAGFWP